MKIISINCWDILYDEIEKRKNDNIVIGMFTHCGYLNLSVILVNQLLEKAPLRYRVFVNNDYSKYIIKDAEGVAIIKEFDNKKELVDWIEVIAQKGNHK